MSLTVLSSITTTTMAPGPISKRKSCADCVKAKRKCGMEFPRCVRCAKKDIECLYPNNNVTVADGFTGLEFSWLDGLLDDPNTLTWTGQLPSQLGAASYGTSSTTSDAALIEPLPPGFKDLPPCGHTPYAEIKAALHRFKTWPDKWVKEGKAPFIHPRLYTAGMPRSLQDAYAACAIYCTKTEQNESVAFTVIEAKANELLHSPERSSWTTMDLLAAVQALLIFQFIRLLDGDIRQRASAEKAEPILQTWADQLKASTTEEQSYTTKTAPSWQSWVFGESIRRTVTMSFYLAGAYSLQKHDFCTFGEKVTSNSFTAQRHIWEAQNSLEWERAKQMYDAYWIPNMSFEHIFHHGTGKDLDDFGMVLLLTYKGKDVVDDWTAKEQPQQHSIMETDLHRTLLDAI
jgi:hypothetical protein